MTRFQEVGVDRQHNSATPAESDRNFENSCKLCASRGMCGDCDNCPIAAAHKFVSDTFRLVSEIKRERRACGPNKAGFPARV